MKRLLVVTCLLWAGMVSTAGATAAPAYIHEASTVHTEADLLRVSPAAQKYIETPVRETHTITTNKPIKPDAQVPPGCYWVRSTWNRYNVYGWVLTSSSTTVYNWCQDGFHFTSTPWPSFTENTHWGWGFCGLQNQFGGFLYPWEYGAGATFTFHPPGPCVPWATFPQSPEVFVYQNGVWQTV